MVESKELKGYLDRKRSESEEEKDMCRAITELIEDGRNEGIEMSRIEMAKEMLKANESLEKIMNYSKLSAEKIRKIAKEQNIAIC